MAPTALPLEHFSTLFSHEETLAALEEIGATVYGTDSSGDIVVTTYGETYMVVTAK